MASRAKLLCEEAGTKAVRISREAGEEQETHPVVMASEAKDVAAVLEAHVPASNAMRKVTWLESAQTLETVNEEEVAVEIAISVISQATLRETARIKTQDLLDAQWSATSVLKRVTWPETVPMRVMANEEVADRVHASSATRRAIWLVSAQTQGTVETRTSASEETKQTMGATLVEPTPLTTMPGARAKTMPKKAAGATQAELQPRVAHREAGECTH